MSKLVVLVVIGVLLVGGMVLIRSPETPTDDVAPPTRGVLALLDALEATDGDRSEPGSAWPPSFPEDHGAHLREATETWQFAGQVTTRDGRPFGFRLDFYRLRMLASDAPPRQSAWATRHVYRAQLSVTDVQGKRFAFFERHSRDGPSLAGAERSPPHVRVEDWAVELTEETTGRSLFRLKAGERPVALDLALEPLTASVPLTADGQSEDAGRSPFRAYRLPRLQVAGTLKSGEETHAVLGSGWLEHAWGDIPLPVGQVVWDRITLQLGDGTDVVVFQLRRRDGSRPPRPSAMLVGPSGDTQAFSENDLSLDIVDEWVSSVDDITYPARWRLEVPKAAMVLDIRSSLPDQEVFGTLRHWSGKVQVTGRRNDQAVNGWGYADLFGYGDSP